MGNKMSKDTNAINWFEIAVGENRQGNKIL